MTKYRDGLEDNLDIISNRLHALSQLANAVFAISASDRALSFCSKVSRGENRPEWLLAQVYVDNIWNYLLGHIEVSKIRVLSRKMEVDMPSLVEDTSLPRILAQNLYIAIDVALDFCLEKNVKPIAGEFIVELLKASILSSTTGYVELGSALTSDHEQGIEGHPFIVREIDFQIVDLKALERLYSIRPHDTEAFKSRARSSSIFPNDFPFTRGLE